MHFAVGDVDQLVCGSPAVGPLFALLVSWIVRSTITAMFTESGDFSSVLRRAVHHALRGVVVYCTLSHVLLCGLLD